MAPATLWQLRELTHTAIHTKCLNSNSPGGAPKPRSQAVMVQVPFLLALREVFRMTHTHTHTQADDEHNDGIIRSIK